MNENERSETGRFFFGLDIKAPWPEALPHGRIIAEKDRHLTLAFLGTQKRTAIDALLPKLPPPPFQIGPAGIFDACLFFPPTRHPRCVAWHVEWQTNGAPFFDYQRNLTLLLEAEGLTLHEKRPFTPHITVCRSPFYPRLWKKAFYPLPLITSAICLYESLGHSTYRTIFRHELIEPIVEIEHTADCAFLIRANSYQELYKHAEIALAFIFAPFIGYFRSQSECRSLDDVITELNTLIGVADSEIGCPLKAVSFHSDLVQKTPEIMEWEMIIDV